MRAILIAPDLADKNLLVQELDIEDNLQAIYKALDCSLIDTIRLDENGSVMYVDDEGYMNKDYFFAWGQAPMPLAGRGLLLGTNMNTGESDDLRAYVTVPMVRDLVMPLTAKQAYEMASQEDEKHKAEAAEQPNTIYISVHEIMEGAWYSDQLELET